MFSNKFTVNAKVFLLINTRSIRFTIPLNRLNQCVTLLEFTVIHSPALNIMLFPEKNLFFLEIGSMGLNLGLHDTRICTYQGASLGPFYDLQFRR
jgi:hypothetical protein